MPAAVNVISMTLIQQPGHPVQVPRWPSIFTPGKYKENQVHRGQLIFHRVAKQKLCLKNLEIP